MKRLILSLSVLLAASAQAQSWSNIKTTTDLPVVQISDPFQNFSAMELMPDAITTNAGNAASEFEDGTVFTVYSPEHESENAEWSGETPWVYYGSQEVGAWLLITAPNAAHIYSKKILVPNSINVMNEDVNWPNEPLSYLRISSLQYDYAENRELLVFTGSIKRHENEELGLKPYNVMVVGTYNLLNDAVQIRYLDDQFSFIQEETNYGVFQIPSHGIGVRQTEDNNFLAIGRTGDALGTPDLVSANYPIGVLFNVGNSGMINIIHSEAKNVLFKPMAVANSGGNELIAAGIHWHDPVYFPSGNKTFLSVALFSFEAVYNSSTGYSLELNRGIVTHMEEYSTVNQLWGPTPSYIDLFVEDQNVYVGFSERLGGTTGYGFGSRWERGVGNPVFGIYDLGLTSSSYSKVGMYSPNNDEIYGGVHRLLPLSGESFFEALMVVDDLNDSWGRPNNTSIGVLRIDKASLAADLSHGLISVWSDDQTSGNFLREVTHVTGVHDGGSHDFLFADGHAKSTSYSRSHMFSVYGDDYPCFDITENLVDGSVLPDDQQLDEPSTMAPPTISSATLAVAELEYEERFCDSFAGKSSLNEESVATEAIAPSLQRVESNRYSINNLESPVLEYKLMNLAGQQVPVKIVGSQINLNHLPSGIYLLQFESAGQQFSEKLLVD